ncbi:MAG TPA: cytochrome c oxidase assembly factor Coa1 family protein [Pyrinomonadaceae bacterium]|jgi:hypothetical protein
MRNKKLLMIVGGVVAGAVLLVVLLGGVVAGVVFYAVANSDAAETAKDFLRRDETLKADIGEVRDFGYFVTGKLHVNSPDGDATIELKVVGARRTTNATVHLVYRNGHEWRVSGASYKNEAGELVKLLDAYETPETPPERATQEGDRMTQEHATQESDRIKDEAADETIRD